MALVLQLNHDPHPLARQTALPLDLSTVYVGRNRLGSRLDQTAQVTNWQLEREIDRLENDGEEYPPTCRAANESTCSTSLVLVSRLASLGPDAHMTTHRRQLTITKSLAVEAFPVKSSARSQYATVNKAKVRTSVRKIITKQTFVRNAQTKKMNDTTPMKTRKKPMRTRRRADTRQHEHSDTATRDTGPI